MRTIAKLILFMVVYVNLTCVVFAQNSATDNSVIEVTSEVKTEYLCPINDSIEIVTLNDCISSKVAVLVAEPIVDIEPVAEGSAQILSNEEIELIALVTMAEAEGECEEGKRLVIDTILNRVDSEHFPDTVSEVIYQPHQFSSMWNGRVDRCCVREDICQLVREELVSRTNYDVMFFTAGGYSNYGTPMFQVEHHYFSSY